MEYEPVFEDLGEVEVNPEKLTDGTEEIAYCERYEGKRTINFHKRRCKMIKKFSNPENMTLMQIQHKYAQGLGYRNWKELLEKENK